MQSTIRMTVAVIRRLSLGAGIAMALAVEAVAAPQAQVSAQQCLRGFIEPQSRHPHNRAAAALAPRLLPVGEPLDEVRYTPHGGGQTRLTLEQYLAMFCTTGFLVLHEGRVVFERYLQGTGPATALLSASMSKTILAVLIGIAVDEGRLRLDQRVLDVMPDFAGSAFGPMSIESLLRMASGVALVNSYDSKQQSDNQAINPILSPQQSVRDYLRGRQAREAVAAGTPQGLPFHYNGAVSAMLGLTLRQATGQSNTDYLSSRLWGSIGAEAPAYWLTNRHGEEAVQGHFAATLRDYGRIGLLLEERGRAGSAQVVSSDWIDAMGRLRRDWPQPQQAPWYGLHTWIPQAAGGRMFAWGTNGQNIFVDPVARVVIVHTGNSPDASFNGNSHLFALRDAIVGRLRERGTRPIPRP